MLVRQRDTTMMPHLQKLKQVLLSEMIQNLELAMTVPKSTVKRLAVADLGISTESNRW